MIKSFKLRIVFSIVFSALVCTSLPAAAEDSPGSSDWEFGASVYLWGANITAETADGSESQVPFYTLLDDLQMAFMGAFEARKGKWSIVTDAIYMDVKARDSQNATFPGFGSVTAKSSVELKAWIVSPTARYLVSETDKARFELLGGVRYLYLDAEAKVSLDGANVLDGTQSGSNWDAIVGAHLEYQLNDKWYLPVYLDVGAGNSKSTWQGMAGIGYRFNRLSMILTYRYLDYDFKNDSPILGGMTMKGPLAGVTFRF